MGDFFIGQGEGGWGFVNIGVELWLDWPQFFVCVVLLSALESGFFVWLALYSFSSSVAPLILYYLNVRNSCPFSALPSRDFFPCLHLRRFYPPLFAFCYTLSPHECSSLCCINFFRKGCFLFFFLFSFPAFFL